MFLTKPFLLGLLFGVLAAALVWFVVTNLIGAEAPVDRRIPSQFPVTGDDFRKVLDALVGPPPTRGNTVEVLENGVEIFPAMLEAIRDAEQSICFETYVYWQGDVAVRFAKALAERARAGVKVHVLLDWVGSNKMDPALIEEMKEAGVEVERYRPPSWRRIDRFNNRTHRKLLIADGKVGFTGGVGIADEWTGDAQDPDHWRDLHFRVTGPVVAQIQAGFMDNWLETRRELLIGDEYFPTLEPTGEVRAQNFVSSPEEGSQDIQLVFLLAIDGARESLRIGTAYFVPDEITLESLLDAAARGVEVQIITPGPYTDAEITQHASRSEWGRLLEAGAQFYEYQPTMYHTKMMVVDDYFVTVGSTNFDNRSFRLNDEANLNVLDRGFAARMNEVFDRDLEHSRRMTLEEWQDRPLRERLTEWWGNLVESQL